MDSFSFLTGVNVGLALYSLILFSKLIVQFKWPDHPAKLTAYLVSFCVTIFFCFKAATGMGHIPPWVWLKWRPLPMVAGSLALLLQVIMTVGNFSLLQQKVVSRLPLIGALLCLAFFPTKAEIFIGATLFAGCLFFSFSLGKARYQKRQFFKMILFLLLYYGCRLINHYWVLILGEFFLFFALFYLFIFEQTFGVMALVDNHKRKQEELV